MAPCSHWAPSLLLHPALICSIIPLLFTAALCFSIEQQSGRNTSTLAKAASYLIFSHFQGRESRVLAVFAFLFWPDCSFILKQSSRGRRKKKSREGTGGGQTGGPSSRADANNSGNRLGDGSSSCNVLFMMTGWGMPPYLLYLHIIETGPAGRMLEADPPPLEEAVVKAIWEWDAEGNLSTIFGAPLAR